MDKVQEFHKRIKEIRDDLKAHAQVTDDPKCVALCETSGEVVEVLSKHLIITSISLKKHSNS